MPKAPVSFKLPDVFENLRKGYSNLNAQRKVLYEGNPSDTSPGNNELKYRELENLNVCVTELYALEPKLIHNFVDTNPFLQTLTNDEKQQIVNHLVSNMHALEGPYFSWRFSEYKEDDFWVMPNKTYVNMSSLQKYFNCNCGVLKGIQVDLQTVTRLFQVTFTLLTKVVNQYIAPMNPAFDELLFLIGLKLYDPSIQNISNNTRQRLQALRNYLIDEMAVTYKKMRLNADQRLKSLLVVSRGIEEYTHRIREDMLLFRCFNFTARGDKMIDKVWGIPGDF
uniref:NR LBD domain-containing protein n=1 Tax=Panagrellus redivivus TaxID=6233 RepID=A0A7E4VKU3_PANRE